MSADRQRLVGAIRRIVKEDPEVRELLDAYDNRGDQAGSGAKAASQGEQERICCDGSTAPPNAGTEERDPDASSQTGLDSDDPARLTAGDGTLSGVTDCATGEPVCMDGSSHIPPDGWDAPDEPPVDPDFVQGCRWTHSISPAGETYATPDAAYAASGQPAYCLRETESDGSSCAGVRYRYKYPDGGGNCVITAGISSSEPGTTPEGEIPYADWPSDGCVNLALKSGTIVGSKYDPENSGSYSTPKTSIQLCDNANGKSILYQPLPGGGFRTIESSGGAAVSGAVGYTYSSDGTLTGTITQAEWDATAP